MTTEAAGDPSGSSDCQDQDDQRFGQLMQRWPSPQSKLEKHAHEFFLHHNRSIAKGGQGRDQRFIHKGKLEPEKKDDDDGYISDDDCIVVLYDMTKAGPTNKDRKYEVFYGNVPKLTYENGGKLVPCPRAHIHEKTGEATCKWFDEKLDSKTGRPVLHRGKRVFHLTVNNPAGFNDEVVFANILAGVRMTLDKDKDCWLLNSTDYVYAERQKDRYSKYHDSTPQQQARHGSKKNKVGMPTCSD